MLGKGDSCPWRNILATVMSPWLHVIALLALGAGIGGLWHRLHAWMSGERRRWLLRRVAGGISGTVVGGLAYPIVSDESASPSYLAAVFAAFVVLAILDSVFHREAWMKGPYSGYGVGCSRCGAPIPDGVSTGSPAGWTCDQCGYWNYRGG